MRVRDVIRAPKTNVQVSSWKQGSIPASAFQLRRHQTGRDLGRTWLWRTIDFVALDCPCRVLIQFHELKRSCSFTLGIVASDGFLKIICVREFHISEPGWHCHAVLRCEDGVTSFAHHGVHRRPRKPAVGAEFGVEQRTATAMAAKFFCLDVRGELL